ncbi:BspA family leucine-rich repeat surface protein, partial [Paratractidigestivibacter sp.]|uniref:BspA family leucine-rich repeat surface protein n=1 Tax=Paratractidigestivibacter sp. TaxID=2847316 RepID=UPI002ACB1413
MEVPTNPVWKDKSTATASWDAVDGANYYIVNVYVEANGAEVGSTTTGTSATELDLQHEINTIIGEREYDEYSVYFDVAAQFLNDGTTIVSEASEKSGALTVSSAGKTKLATPTNVTLSDDGVLTWDGYDANTDYVRFSARIEYAGGVKELSSVSSLSSYEYEVSGGSVSADVGSALKNAYSEAGFSGETVSISLRVAHVAFLDNVDYLTSGKSEYSNSIVYSASGKTKLATPTNVTLSDDGVLTWDGYDANTDYVRFSARIEYAGGVKELSSVSSLSSYEYEVSGGSVSADVGSALKNAYSEAGFSGETVSISLRVAHVAFLDNVDYLTSDKSEYSNSIYYNPSGSTAIDQIALSPSSPLIAVGKSMYVGKTISPENAYYSRVNWSCSDDSVFTVDSNGQITGVAKGNATLTAKINNASTDATVSVYELSTNVDDSDDSATITDAAADTVEQITKGEDTPKADIDNADQVKSELEEAAQRGDEFNVDLNKTEKPKDDLDASWSDVEQAAGGKEFASAYDVTLDFKHTEQSGAEHHIGTITELDKEISFELEKPQDLPEVESGHVRDYSIVRIQDGVAESVPFEMTEDGNFRVTSSKFSDYVVMYSDVATSAEDTPDYIAGWTTSGTCEWSIDADGNLVVRPANGAESGTLASWSTWSSYRDQIKTATFRQGVSATDASRMFWYCPKLTTVDLSGLDTSGVTDMSYMFYNCSSLRSLDLSRLNTSRVTDMSSMFYGCSKLSILELSSFNTANATNM